jgi:thiamine biosynthesis protein ThiI
MKLSSRKSFAVRARRSGTHEFTSQDIGREVGDAINILTNAKIDLTNPDEEVFIECRQKKAYGYFGKEQGVGGLPLGVSGAVIGIIDSKDDIIACWLLMKRGCRIVVLYTKKGKKYLKYLKKWHIGLKLKNRELEDIKNIKNAPVCVSENKYIPILYKQKLLVLRPLVAFDSKKINEYWVKIKSF